MLQRVQAKSLRVALTNILGLVFTISPLLGCSGISQTVTCNGASLDNGVSANPCATGGSTSGANTGGALSIGGGSSGTGGSTLSNTGALDGGQVTGDNGGAVKGENSEVDIPQGAIVGGITVTIDQGTSIAADGEWKYYPAGPPIRLGPSGTTFSKPVTVTLNYLPSIVGNRPDLFVVAHRDDLTQAVTFIHPSAISGSLVSVPATSFSTFQPVMYTELMAGVVRDRSTNLPLPGAQVFFYGSGYGNVIADANGAYSFTIEKLSSFGGALSGTLYTGTDGYFQAPTVSVSDLGAQSALPVVNDFTLLPSSPLVTGVVTDAASGLGVAGATVSFNRNPMSTFRGGATTVSVTTGSDGSYAIDPSYFAENPSGDFSVSLMVNATGYLGASQSLSFNPGPVTQNFALYSSSGALMTGTVRDRNTNAPIVGAGVFFYGSGDGNAVTDASGVYTFTASQLSSFGGALSGTLYVGADGYFQAPAVSVSALGAQSALPVVNDFTLLPSSPLVTGVVTDSRSGLGVAGATVSFNRNPMSTFRGGATTVSVTTGSDGSYAIDPSYFAENPSGDFSVSLMVNATGYLGASQSLSFNPGPITQNFALNSSSGVLMTGTVRDRNTNDPIVGAGVFFYGSGDGNAVTDASGVYTFTVSQLSSFGGGLSGTLYVGSNGYFEAPTVSVSNLGAQPSLPVVNDFTLLPSGPLVTGVVTDSKSGLGIAGATVSFNRNPMSTFRGGATTVSVTTSSDGSYAIDPSYFAENPSGDFSVNLMVNATGYLGATQSLSFHDGPVVENIQLTSGTSG